MNNSQEAEEWLLLKHLEKKAKYNSGSASRPFDRRGAFFLDPKTELNRLTSTATQAHAISIASPDLYQAAKLERPPLAAPRLEKTRVKEVHFPPEAELLDAVRAEYAEKDSITQVIRDYIHIAHKKIVNDGAYLTNAFTPFFAERQVDGVFVEKQVSVGPAFADWLNQAMIELNALPDLRIEQPAKEYEVVHSVTRAYLFPLALPLSSENDFDSGDCNMLLAGSFRRGEKVLCLASVDGYDFVINAVGTVGWVDNSHVAKSESNPQNEDSQNLQPMYYYGKEPLFFSGEVLLPGDTVYYDFQSNKAKVKLSNGNSEFRYVEVPNIGAQQLTEGFDFSRNGLQEALDFLYQLEGPYMWSVFDCSAVMDRVFTMAGIRLQKYSGDMMRDLEKVFDPRILVKKPEQLDELEDGVYTANLLDPTAEDPNKESKHMYLVVKKDGEFKAFSYAFDLVGDSGGVDRAIGPHVCGKNALTTYLTRTEKRRDLAFIKLIV